MKRKQIMVVAGSALVVLFCAWSVWRLAREMRDATAAERQRDAARAQLEDIFRINPFPSDANLKRRAQDHENIKQWIDAIGLLLVRPESAASLSPPLFMQNMRNKIQELSGLSSGPGLKLAPEGFAFGFDRYSGADGRMPEPEDVPRLSLQLGMIDRLCHELALAGVTSLRVIKRNEFEIGSAKPVVETPGSEAPGRGRRTRSTAGAASKASAATGKPQSIRHPFEFEFVASRNACLEVLNRLASMDLFVVVTDLALRKSAEDLKPVPEAPVESGKAGKKMEMPEPMLRVISGPLVDPPLNVRLQLDVHLFEGV